MHLGSNAYRAVQHLMHWLQEETIFKIFSNRLCMGTSQSVKTLKQDAEAAIIPQFLDYEEVQESLGRV